MEKTKTKKLINVNRELRETKELLKQSKRKLSQLLKLKRKMQNRGKVI